MRFLLFAGQNYYPSGGWDDFVDEYNTQEEALKACEEWKNSDKAVIPGSWKHSWAHIVDRSINRIIRMPR